MRTQLLFNACLTNCVLFSIYGLIVIKPHGTAYIYIAVCELQLKIPHHKGLKGERRHPLSAWEAFTLKISICWQWRGMFGMPEGVWAGNLGRKGE